MRMEEILSLDRVAVDRDGAVSSKAIALDVVGNLLSRALGTTASTVIDLLIQREQLQSTGIGDGVAIPHAFLDAAPKQTAALLICPSGVDFDAIDSAPVAIILGIVGPKAAEHLRVLASISRLLGHQETRRKLIAATSAEEAFAVIADRDRAEELPRTTVDRP